MKNIDWEILNDYLSGNLADEEKEQFEDRLDKNAEAKAEYEKIKMIWNSAPQNFPKPNTEKALKNVLNRIQNEKREDTPFNIHPIYKKPLLITTLAKSNIVRAAAVIVILAGAALVIMNLITTKNNELVSFTSKDIQKITLSDGTKVTLDAGSYFSYPKDFSDSGGRDVNLNGEAFFEVTRNENSKFTVHANNGLITVLGTKFNVRSWKKEKEVTVAVSEGKVSLQTEDKKHGTILTKGELSQVTENGTVTKPVIINLYQYLSWMNREIYFKSEKLEKVLNQIERWYDVKIELKDTTFLNNRITIFIENKPIDDNLKMISLLTNLKYERKGDKIIFTSR